jgi:5-methylthioadenosine/S-adenosylhomocysteine deaminase
MGVLSERTAAVHGVWLDGEEIRMLADEGGCVVANPRSNMALGDGIANLEGMAASGMRVALGCDGPCANNGLDIFSEMRTAEHLQRVRRQRINVLPQAAALGGAAADYPFSMGTRFGAEALAIPAGALEKGRYADILAVDCRDASMQPNAFAGPRPPKASRDRHALDPSLANVIFSMTPRSALKAVFVGGRRVF